MIANTIKTQASTGSSVDEYATGKNGRGPFKKGMDLRTPNLLVVDDDATVRQQLERLYTQSGYSVVTVSSAEEGIAPSPKKTSISPSLTSSFRGWMEFS